MGPERFATHQPFARQKYERNVNHAFVNSSAMERYAFCCVATVTNRASKRGTKNQGLQEKMSSNLSKPRQQQILLSAMFVAALSFITLAASFAEMPENDASVVVLTDE